MSARKTLATAARVLSQLRHDRRTLALVFVVPPALLVLLRYILDGSPLTFARIGPELVGLFPLIVMFLVTSIAMLRERTTGTLERLMSLPIGKVDLLLGYGLAFALLAAIQAVITGTVGFWLLGLHTKGSVVWVVLLAVANALLGVSLGLFLSAFAKTEFQAVQFMPALLFPQILLAGLFAPRDEMPRVLRIISDFLPVTYAYDALVRVTTGVAGRRLAVDIAVTLGCVVVGLALGAATLRRRTP